MFNFRIKHMYSARYQACGRPPLLNGINEPENLCCNPPKTNHRATVLKVNKEMKNPAPRGGVFNARYMLLTRRKRRGIRPKEIEKEGCQGEECLMLEFNKKLATTLQGCRSNVIGERFASSPQ
jgi:hypothetical protein